MHITDKMRTNHENSRKTMVQNNIEKFIVKSPSKEHRHYQFLWFILQFRRNYLLEYSVCFNKVSHKYYFSSSIVLCSLISLFNSIIRSLQRSHHDEKLKSLLKEILFFIYQVHMHKMIKGSNWISISHKISVNNKKNLEAILILRTD